MSSETEEKAPMLEQVDDTAVNLVTSGSDDLKQEVSSIIDVDDDMV